MTDRAKLAQELMDADISGERIEELINEHGYGEVQLALFQSNQQHLEKRHQRHLDDIHRRNKERQKTELIWLLLLALFGVSLATLLLRAWQ